MKRIIVILALLFIFPTSILAANCGGTIKEEYTKMANNITYVIEMNDDGNENRTANITFSGLSKDLLIKESDYSTGKTNYYNEYFGEYTYKNLPLGTNYNFKIIGRKECNIDALRIINITLPNYNPYYNDPICENARNYKLCQKWTTVNVTYEEFQENVKNYLNSIPTTKKIIEQEETKFDFYYYYNRYYWYVLGGLIIVLGILIYLWLKDNKKNKL